MDWRDFIASLVDSLAWPVAVVVLALVLRSHLTGLLSGPLRRLKLGPGGAELEWHETAAEVATSSARALPVALEDDETEDALGNLERMAQTAPGEAVMQTAVLVLQELRRMVDAAGIELLVRDSDNPNILIKSAYRGNVINRETGESLRGLLTLRDLTAHNPNQATTEKAVDYIVLARATLYALRRGRR